MLDLTPHEALPEELLMFRESVRRFVEKELVPLEHKLDAAGLLDDATAQQVRERAKAAKRAKRDEARSERTAKNKTGQDEGTEAQAEGSPREDQ